MRYSLFLFFMLLFSVNMQSKGRFSDKIDMKKFTKEYWKISKNKSDVEASKINISELIEKYASKYDVDLNISDTIFILETCPIESMTCYGSLWFCKKIVNFESYKKFKFTSHNIFDAEEIDALFKWDKDIFSLLDEKGRSWLPSNIRYAARIVICNGMIEIDRAEYQY